jgi:hypothetical protein
MAFGVKCRPGRYAVVLATVVLSVGAVLAADGAASAQTRPPTGTALESEFYGMSCTSASACTAAGYYLTSAGYSMLAEGWNGTAWAIQSTATP